MGLIHVCATLWGYIAGVARWALLNESASPIVRRPENSLSCAMYTLPHSSA